jgi:hypothetical protein
MSYNIFIVGYSISCEQDILILRFAFTTGGMQDTHTAGIHLDGYIHSDNPKTICDEYSRSDIHFSSSADQNPNSNSHLNHPTHPFPHSRPGGCREGQSTACVICLLPLTGWNVAGGYHPI